MICILKSKKEKKWKKGIVQGVIVFKFTIMSNTTTWNELQTRLIADEIPRQQSVGVSALDIMGSRSSCETPCPPKTRRMGKKKSQGNLNILLCALVVCILFIVLAILGLNITTVVQDQDETRTVSDAELQVVIDHVMSIKEKQHELKDQIWAIREDETHDHLKQDLLRIKSKVSDIDNGVEDLGEGIEKLHSLIDHVHENHEHGEDDDHVYPEHEEQQGYGEDDEYYEN